MCACARVCVFQGIHTLWKVLSSNVNFNLLIFNVTTCPLYLKLRHRILLEWNVFACLNLCDERSSILVWEGFLASLDNQLENHVRTTNAKSVGVVTIFISHLLLSCNNPLAHFTKFAKYFVAIKRKPCKSLNCLITRAEDMEICYMKYELQNCLSIVCKTLLF